MTAPSQGFWPRLQAWLFGERDEIAAQLKEVANQGRGLARLAHICAFLLIILFSLGSLVALSSDALIYIVGQYQTHGLTPQIIPDGISVVVAVALVWAMDLGMLIAAASLRTLRSRRASIGEMWPHAAIVVCVALIEAGTYLYMAWEFDKPGTFPAWILLAARAIMAPILGVYLSMAAPRPVVARDVLHHVELGVGTGFLRDAISIANDDAAPLAHKARLYKAASVMTDEDEQRLDKVIGVLQGNSEATKTSSEAKLTAREAAMKPRPGSGLYVAQGQDLSGARPRVMRSDESAASGEPPDAPDDGATGKRQSRSILPFRKPRVAIKKPPERVAFDLLDANPDAKENEIMRRAHVGRDRAKQLIAQWEASRAQQSQANAD
ncbi:MAG TPA: hypothetical protein VKQ36_02635 [Ktedonobacterales bacterium]|nr:hypothetical protein [Ktedonobacterales bacterium]